MRCLILRALGALGVFLRVYGGDLKGGFCWKSEEVVLETLRILEDDALSPINFDFILTTIFKYA